MGLVAVLFEFMFVKVPKRAFLIQYLQFLCLHEEHQTANGHYIYLNHRL